MPNMIRNFNINQGKLGKTQNIIKFIKTTSIINISLEKY